MKFFEKATVQAMGLTVNTELNERYARLDTWDGDRCQVCFVDGQREKVRIKPENLFWVCPLRKDEVYLDFGDKLHVLTVLLPSYSSAQTLSEKARNTLHDIVRAKQLQMFEKPGRNLLQVWVTNVRSQVHEASRKQNAIGAIFFDPDTLEVRGLCENWCRNGKRHCEKRIVEPGTGAEGGERGPHFVYCSATCRHNDGTSFRAEQLAQMFGGVNVGVSHASPDARTCAHPSCENPAPLVCDRCRVCYYCSKDCQQSHWKEHKRTCKSAKGK